ncbi:hypothetical protein MASR2M36_39210 [Providencia sp.]
MAVYGPQQLPYALMTYIAQTMIYWTLGIYLLNNDNNSDKLNFLSIIKNIFTPPLLAFIIGVFLLLNQIAIPRFMLSLFDYLSAMTAPIAMLIIGFIIYTTDLKHSKSLALLFLLSYLDSLLLHWLFFLLEIY